MNRFLPLLATRGGGGALILDRCRAFDLFASVNARYRPLAASPEFPHALYTAKTVCQKFETNISRNETAYSLSPNTDIHVSVSDLYLSLSFFTNLSDDVSLRLAF